MKNYYGQIAIAGIIILEVIMGAVIMFNKTSTTPNSGSYQIQQIGGGGGAQPVIAITQATTTPCATPVSATSSIQHWAMTVTTGTSSAGTIAVGTSTSPYATSTKPFATFVIGANSQNTFTWNAGVNNDVASPGTYIVAGMTNGSAVSYGYTYGGTCSTLLLAD